MWTIWVRLKPGIRSELRVFRPCGLEDCLENFLGLLPRGLAQSRSLGGTTPIQETQMEAEIENATHRVKIGRLLKNHMKNTGK